MKKLVFKLDYAGKILSGEKRTTIRLSTELKENEIVEVYVGHVRVGRALIKKVQKKKLSELSDEEIKADGFNSREELLKALAKIYGNKRVYSDPFIYLIEFQLI
ncbi:ASCH domain-containing protein [Ignisphaera sp. 4213-co]|uniref:ASCH domain-containing protein n=1 Tax=Ignisphaera cupida TaxID=3050454 RepID=A0ABD4Z5U7_9CREN|nr:ASCH domain-containing protein [Ignisphaera sp. 4213-co]MDK6028008.1 ASCH domain-containing protein [Ignisphaera sp. 4213-co]